MTNHLVKKPRRLPVLNSKAIKKRAQKKYHLPVIAHFADRSVEFPSILEAERVCQISYHLIFEACVGKIFKAKNIIFEYKKGAHYIKYKAYYERMKQQQQEQRDLHHH